MHCLFAVMGFRDDQEVDVDLQLHAAAQIIADYERGVIPDDQFVFSACHQLTELIRPCLKSRGVAVNDQQFVTVVAEILGEFAKDDLIITALIEALFGTEPPHHPQVSYTPVEVVLGQAPIIVQGNQYNLNGDFRDAIVNVATTLEDTVQYIEAARLPATTQTRLIELLQSLESALQDVPDTHAQSSKSISLAITRLILTAINIEPVEVSLPDLRAEFLQAVAHLENVPPEINTIIPTILSQLQLPAE